MNIIVDVGFCFEVPLHKYILLHDQRKEDNRGSYSNGGEVPLLQICSGYEVISKKFHRPHFWKHTTLVLISITSYHIN